VKSVLAASGSVGITAVAALRAAPSTLANFLRPRPGPRIASVISRISEDFGVGCLITFHAAPELLPSGYSIGAKWMIVRPGYIASIALRNSSAASITDGVNLLLKSISVSTARFSESFVASLQSSKAV
jgi:hypothetical protein